MSKRKPMRKGPKLRAAVVAIKNVRVAVGHTLVLGTTAAGKVSYDLLRTSERGRRQVGRKRADGHGDAGGKAWA